MDFQRNILIAALAVVTLMLFIAWDRDYGSEAQAEKAANAAAEAQRVAANQPQNSAPAATGNTVPAMTENASNDFAGLAPAKPEAPSAAAAATGVAPVAATMKTISVNTDVIHLEIDPVGGDITRLTLPKYPSSLKRPDVPVQLMSKDAVTFVSQSGLLGSQGPDMQNGDRAVYSTDAVSYSLADGANTLEVVLHAPVRDGVSVDKVYRFTRGDYLINVSYRIRNAGTAPWSGFMFGQIKRDLSGDPSHPGGGSFLSASPTYLGGAYASNEAIYNKVGFDDAEEKPVKVDMQGGWVAFIQHYFVSAWVPSATGNNQLYAKRAQDGNFLFGFTSQQITVAPGASGETSAAFFAGPKLQDRLAEISPGLDRTVDYGWFWFFSEWLLWLLVHIEQIFGNWGVAIILLTVLVKILFYYPSRMSYISMAHLRRVTPELTRIRDLYKDDRQKQAQEMMNLYKKEKINPLGGCLPILLQMPVFIALYWVLLESVELRQAPFMLWLTDLSVKDPYFILPILMGISMWIQSKLNPAPADPMQAKMMQWLPWIFTVFFLFFAAGLVLYWLVNNILSIAQQWYVTRQIEKEYAKT